MNGDEWRISKIKLRMNGHSKKWLIIPTWVNPYMYRLPSTKNRK